MKLKVYLAGAIRDGVEYDFKWRRKAHEKLDEHAIIYDPMSSKRFDDTEKVWYIHEEKVTPHFIVQSDFFCVDRADLIIFNFLALQDRYACIGTLTEFGRSTNRSVIRLCIWPQNIKGHQHHMFGSLHPFIDEHVSKVFYEVNPCLEFAKSHLISLGSR